MYTQLGVMTRGTVIEVNVCYLTLPLSLLGLPSDIQVSELGLVTTGGKVVWGEFGQAFTRNKSI